MFARFSHHREPVLNHTDPVNSRHGLQCTADASPFAIMAGQEALCCDQSELSLVRYMQAETPTVVAQEAPRGGVRLVCCERDYPSQSI